MKAEDKIDFNTAKFKYILETAEKHSADSFDVEKVSDEAFQTLLKSIEPDSRYIGSKLFKKITEQDKGEKYSIGISLFNVNDTLVIIKSRNRDLYVGDKVIFIDGNKFTGKNTAQAQKALSGELGESVDLIIKRTKGNELVEIKTKREKYPVKSIKASYMLSNSKVGYIKLDRFSVKTSDEIRKELEILSENDLTHLILDLRNNTGGRLNQVVETASLFLPDSSLITYTEGRNEEYKKKFYSKGAPLYPELPLIIMTDSTSRSGSEMLAAAMQEYDRALLVGSQTYGKGSAQKAFYLKDSTAFRLTVAYYHTPLGRKIDKENFNKKGQEIAGLGKNYSKLRKQIKKLGNRGKMNYVFTPSGRILFETPGLLPDVKAYGDTLTKLTRVMLSNGTFMEYALNYYKNHKNMKEKYNNFKQYTSKFKLKDKMLRDFAKVSLNRNIWNKEMFEQDKRVIMNYIKASVAYLYWGEEAYHYQVLNLDKLLIKAIRALPEARELLNKSG